MTINIGNLNRLVELQSASEQQSPSGEVSLDWSVVANVWASILPMSGRELFSAQQVHADVTHNIAIRYRSDVTPKMRLVRGNRTFDILSVIDVDDAHVMMKLVCREQM